MASFVTFQKDRPLAKGYEIIEFGASYRSLRAAMKEIERVLKITIRGFGDMSVEEVSKTYRLGAWWSHVGAATDRR